ncbi:(deoxy)nucleoside triphosphate pyrophosphohydrolase [uncultured Pseudodesulfovibrio sp.]|uniref:(deoxy)nucleoside triphosphate pyrophosphohydrolase n=1 Tax=uncultured Pseudodesulfovibrio sp. TaxID=2035858 RepID=UPI0029C8E4A8|nr:(deoxy)nucleoside triphosphate pyrophosphohydrolase [uncultured Pseudodesulfovibrio sp.]
MMKPCLDVVAGIIWQNGLYLAVERPEGFRMAGWWEFPGGKIEKGESRENAIIRELQEELGVTPLDFEFWQDMVHEYDDFFVRLHFFNIHKYSGELASLEGQRWEWVDPALPPVLKYLPADVKIVEALHG